MTQRIPSLDPRTATGPTRDLFDTLQKKIGRVPNILKAMGNSPAALRGYVALNDALAQGLIPPALREQIALTIGEANQCDYCISAHTAIGKMAGLDENDVEAARRSHSDDEKTEAALTFVHKMVLSRGQSADEELQRLHAAGYSDAEVIEIIAHIALNTFTNYFNLTANTELDYPRTTPLGVTA